MKCTAYDEVTNQNYKSNLHLSMCFVFAAMLHDHVGRTGNARMRNTPMRALATILDGRGCVFPVEAWTQGSVNDTACAPNRQGIFEAIGVLFLLRRSRNKKKERGICHLQQPRTYLPSSETVCFALDRNMSVDLIPRGVYMEHICTFFAITLARRRCICAVGCCSARGE